MHNRLVPTAAADVDASTTAAPVNSAGRFAHIDAMRALAVMLVVVAHAGLENWVPGGSGVTVFFAISGFVITWVTLRERDRTGTFALGGFYQRRFFKLAPPMLVAVLVPTVAYSWSHQVDLDAVAGQVFFYFNWVELSSDGPIDVLPGSEVVWSLAIEEQFYIVFAAGWLVALRSARPTRWLAGVAVTAAVLSAGSRVLLAVADGPEAVDRIYYGTDTRLEGIALGILAAVLVHAGRHRWATHPAVPVIALAAFLASLVYRDDVFRDTLRYTVQSLATCAWILHGFAVDPQRRGASRLHTLAGLSAVQLVGRASYSIYLCHFSMIWAVEPATDRLPASAEVLVNSLVGVVVGVALFRLVEAPVASWRAGRSGRPV